MPTSLPSRLRRDRADYAGLSFAAGLLIAFGISLALRLLASPLDVVDGASMFVITEPTPAVWAAMALG